MAASRKRFGIKQIAREVVRCNRKLSIPDTEDFIQTVFDVILAQVKNDERVEVRGFGQWRKFLRSEHKGVNPVTMAEITVPERIYFKFKPSKGVLNG
jgi:integration host factor subunit beta